MGCDEHCPARRIVGDVSDDFDADASGVSRKRLDVGTVSGEDRASWFGQRDDEGIDGGTGTSESVELGGPAGDVHADGGFDDARLHEAVGVGVAAGTPCSDSTSTIVGRSGGHNSCAVRARISETEVFVRAARRESPPLSRTSTFS